VRRLVLALLLMTLLLLTSCGTAVPGGEEGSDGAPGGGQADVGDEGQAEEPLTEGPALTG
jgi:predicted small secreted protein